MTVVSPADDLQNALVDARHLLDVALRENRSWESRTRTVAQYFTTTEEFRDQASVSLEEADREVLCVAHDGWYRDDWLDATCDRVSRLMDRGVRMRKLCPPNEWTGWFRGANQLREFADLGMEIRVAENQLDEMFMIDGSAAYLRVRTGQDRHECLLVRSAAVLRSLGSLFTATWDAAHDPSSYALRDGELDGADRQVLGLLSAGYKDDSAARELGWSVRTYRRHVARIMHELNATSRFQAGVRAAELGLTGN